MKRRFIPLYFLMGLTTIFILLFISAIALVGGRRLLISYLAPNIVHAASEIPIAEFLSHPARLPKTEADILASYEDALTHIYAAALPAMVKIDATRKVNQSSPYGFEQQSPFPPFFSFPQPPQQSPLFSQGSGFVWDDEGHIVTNFHVVQDADTVEVTFADETITEAEILGTDPDADLAVLKVDLPAAKLQPVALGDSDSLQVGQLAVAIGNPFGQEFTMTSGIISAVERTIRSGNSPFSIPEVIQTDAPINPGNSGGPLLNRKGEVIGINSQIISRSGASAGIGFAVPINTAKQIVPTLIEGRDYQHAWLGISGGDLTEDVAGLMDLPPDLKGTLVISVAQGSPADKAGLRGSDKTLTVGGREFAVGGDVITAIDDHPVSGIEDVIVYLSDETRPGDQVTLDIIHAGGEEAEVTVTLGSRPRNK